MSAAMSAEAAAVSDLLRPLSNEASDASQAHLQGSNPSVGYDFFGATSTTAYVDREGFEGYSAQFADETKGIVELEALDRWAAELASTLYTYRSIARALPTVSGDEAHKKAMYAATFEVLHPQISRVKALISFKERAKSLWLSNLSLLVRAESRHKGSSRGDVPIPCEALYVQLLNSLDMLAVLDALKDTKACLNNDFSAYKRSFAHVRADVPDAEAVTNENNLLQPLLANPQAMLQALKTSVQQLPGFDAVVADMATLAIEHLENDWYLLPEEKHRLLRCAAHALWLLDAPDKGGVNAFAHKRIKKERFGKWFRRYPIVPMYGDMFANLQHILMRAPNWASTSPDDFFATSRKELAAVAYAYDIAAQLPGLHAQAAALTADLAHLLQRVELSGGGAKCALSREDHCSLALRLYEETLSGCKLLSSASSLLRESLVFKCTHPCSDETLLARCVGDARDVTDYERALRYNLSVDERTALVELLALLKGLQATLQKVCGGHEVLLARAVHEKTQRFVHETMGGPMRKAVKYEKKALKATLLQLRNMCADWAGDPADLLNEKAIVSKEFKFASHSGDYPARSTPPTQTQIWLMRATTRALYDERSPYIKSSLMNEADLPKEAVKEMRDFVSDSSAFPYLMRLSSTLQSLGDVACLWMREFYLELCKRVQFPISMSLPAILTEHVLSAGNSRLMPLLLYAFDAYSDAGDVALRVHQQQHLFVEIEAECNLLFDQTLYALSEQLFAHFKTRASAAVLAELDSSQHLAWADTEVASALGKAWYLPLTSIQAARILGRSVDLSRLLTQRMNAMLRQSLDLALARFESRPIDAVVDLHRSVRVTRLTHLYLSEALPSIDPFEACLGEANDATAFLCFSSRALSHALTECLADLLPNFAYRSESNAFQRPLPTPFTQPPERDPPPRMLGAHLAYGTRQLNAEFAMHAARASGVFGAAHAEALVGVLGEAGVLSLLGTLSSHIEELLLYGLHAYVTELQQALPESIKLPSHQYGATGCKLFFEAKLKDLAQYEEIHSGVLHDFRRLGNTLSLLMLLEGAVHASSTATLHQLPLKGASPPLALAATAVSSAWGQASEESDLVFMAEQMDTLASPLDSSCSLITKALVSATSVVVNLKDDWLAGETVASDLGAHEETRAFHRVWSAVAFLYATAPLETARGSVDNATLFGDGVLLSGAFLLHALCQRHRFDLLDFNAHVFAVHVADTGGAPPDASLMAYVHRVSLMKKTHERFAAMFEARDAPTIYNVWRRM